MIFNAQLVNYEAEQGDIRKLNDKSSEIHGVWVADGLQEVHTVHFAGNGWDKGENEFSTINVSITKLCPALWQRLTIGKKYRIEITEIED